MASEYEIYKKAAFAAIGELLEQGFLLDDLDWDVSRGKFTLRLRGADRKPMVAVGLITYRRKDNMIVMVNAVTGANEELPLFVGSKPNSAIDSAVCDFAKRLREEAAYK